MSNLIGRSSVRRGRRARSARRLPSKRQRRTAALTVVLCGLQYAVRKSRGRAGLMADRQRLLGPAAAAVPGMVAGAPSRRACRPASCVKKVETSMAQGRTSAATKSGLRSGGDPAARIDEDQPAVIFAGGPPRSRRDLGQLRAATPRSSAAPSAAGISGICGARGAAADDARSFGAGAAPKARRHGRRSAKSVALVLVADNKIRLPSVVVEVRPAPRAQLPRPGSRPAVEPARSSAWRARPLRKNR